MICVNAEHPEKTYHPISVTEEGIVICVSDEHPEKTPFLILLINNGMVTLFTLFLAKTNESKISLFAFVLKTKYLSSMYSILFSSQTIIEIFSIL